MEKAKSLLAGESEVWNLPGKLKEERREIAKDKADV